MLPIAGRQTGTKILQERNVEVARSDQRNTGKPIRNIIWALEEEEIWISELLAWAACGHTKTEVREVVVMIMMSRSYPSLKDIRQFLALSPRQGNSVGGGGGGRSNFL